MTSDIAVVRALAGPCRLLERIAPDRSTRGQAKERIARATPTRRSRRASPRSWTSSLQQSPPPRPVSPPPDYLRRRHASPGDQRSVRPRLLLRHPSTHSPCDRGECPDRGPMSRPRWMIVAGFMPARTSLRERGGFRASWPGTTASPGPVPVAAACRVVGRPRARRTARARWGLSPRRRATFGPAAAAGGGSSLAGICLGGVT